MLDPLHFFDVAVNVCPAKHHVEAVLTDHLQNQDKVLEIPNVVNR